MAEKTKKRKRVIPVTTFNKWRLQCDKEFLPYHGCSVIKIQLRRLLKRSGALLVESSKHS